MPTPTPDIAARDIQRETDLLSYVTAYHATSTGGYYPVNPATVSTAIADPATGVAYVIVTTTPDEIGQIEYLAGGSCGGTNVTPGKALTRQVALFAKLEGSDNLYCLDVK